MAKIKTVRKNWPKYVLQWGVLLAIILFITLAGSNFELPTINETFGVEEGMDYLFPEMDIRGW